jgi:signal transduction histidine kinase
MKKTFFTLLMLFFGLGAWGQSAEIDSLKKELYKADKEKKTDILNQLADVYTHHDRKLMREYAEQALILAKKQAYKKGIMTAYHRLGYFFHLENNSQEAYKNYESAISFANELKDNKMLWNLRNNIAFLRNEQGKDSLALQLYEQNLKNSLGKNYEAYTYRNMSDVYRAKGKWDKNIEVLLKALQIYENLGKGSDIEAAYVADLLGESYSALKQDEKAQEYYDKALKIREKLDDPNELINSYESLAGFHFHKKEYEQARAYWQKALSIYQDLDNKEGIAMTYLSLGESHFEEGDFAETLPLYQKALALESYLNEEGKAFLFHQLGKLYVQNNENEKALDYLNKALELAKKIQKIDLIKEITLSLAQLYIKKNDLPKANEMLRSALVILDSIFSDSLSIRIARTEVAYKVPQLESQNKNLALDNEKMLLENQHLEWKNTISLVIFTSFLIILGLVFLVFVQRKKAEEKRQKQAQIIAEKEAFIKAQEIEQARLLAQKEEIIKAQEQINAYFASELHDGPKSKLRLAIRQVDANTQKILHDILEDITFISEKTADKNHLPLPQRISSFLQRLPAENELMWHFTKNETVPWHSLRPTTALHLFRITTEAVGNVLAHAKGGTQTDVTMEIKLDMVDGHILLSISDDGQGMTQAQIEESKGQGLQNIKNRVEILNGSLKISSLGMNEGTTIEVRVPL